MTQRNFQSSNEQKPLIIWYDPNAYTDEGQEDRAALQGTFGSVMAMNEESEFKRFFGRYNQNQRLIVILSGRVGQKLIPEIHEESSILSVYIYCQDKKANEKWAKDYSKVKAVATTLEDLVLEMFANPTIDSMTK